MNAALESDAPSLFAPSEKQMYKLTMEKNRLDSKLSYLAWTQHFEKVMMKKKLHGIGNFMDTKSKMSYMNQKLKEACNTIGSSIPSYFIAFYSLARRINEEVDMDKISDPRNYPNVEVTRVLLTGPPSAGKSSLGRDMAEQFGKMGYRTLFIKESAKEVLDMNMGNDDLYRSTQEGRDLFQSQVSVRQVHNEELAEQQIVAMMAASQGEPCKIIAFFDRGLLDVKAFAPTNFADIMSEAMIVLNPVNMRYNDLPPYDVVMCLGSTASLTGGTYQTDLGDLSRRQHTAEEARVLDTRFDEVYGGHANYHRMPATGSPHAKFQLMMRTLGAACPLVSKDVDLWFARQALIHWSSDDIEPTEPTRRSPLGAAVPAYRSRAVRRQSVPTDAISNPVSAE